jgi:L-amino acid N-acyltransferase YncA
VQVRPATPDDIEAIQAIYAHHVLKGLASFEEEPVAEFGGIVAGYAYCSLYRSRSAYRYSLEDSVYVRPDAQGRGIGKTLLGELIRRAEALGYRQMIAVIGDSANVASIGLHESEGFVRAGTLRSVGFKFGRWVDSVIMQRPLGSGDSAPP